LFRIHIATLASLTFLHTLCHPTLQDAEVEAPVAAAAQGDPELAGLEARLANLKR
jgi:hypothetical protein